jgi:hypothetical protein
MVFALQELDHVQQGGMRLRQTIHEVEHLADDGRAPAMIAAGRRGVDDNRVGLAAPGL